MRSLRRALVLVGALAGAATASCGSTTPGLDHDLSGIVINADTGAPIAGAAVTFSTDTLRTYDTTTGSDGVYRLIVDVDVPFGQVSATKLGFSPVSATVYFDTSIRRTDLQMRAMPM